MKSANKISESEIGAGIPPETAIDPFAVDFFGAKPATISSDENNKTRENFFNFKKVSQRTKKSEWYKKLPKVSINEAEFSDSIQSLPEELNAEITKVISQMIAKYTFRQPDKVACSIISIAEKNINRSIKNLAKTPQIFFTISGVSDNSTALMTLNTQFAATVIDVILGSQTDENTSQRDLSPIEITITEFMVVTILSEINRFLGNSLLTLQTVETKPSELFEAEERGVEMVFLIEIDGFSGILTAFLPRKFFSQFENAPNPLFIKDFRKRDLARFERLTPEIDLNVQIGTTFLDANSLLYLETDDIVLVENPEISLDKGLLGSNLQICVGRGKNFRLTGNADTKEFET
jgi:hypothetical protein